MIFLEVILKSLLVGFLVSAPLGPTGALCIKKSLINKDRTGYHAGYGITSVDTIFAIISVLGITLISDFISFYEITIRGVGGLLLIGLGIKELFDRSSPLDEENGNEEKNTFKKNYLSGVTLAIVNPVVILSFLALYAMFGLAKIGNNYALAGVMVLSTFVGSFFGLWGVNWIAIKYGHKLDKKILININKILGWVLIVTGIGFILFAIKTYFLWWRWKKGIKYETFIFFGILVVLETLLELFGFVDMDSDWFWFLAGITLVFGGFANLVKQKQFDKKFKILSKEEYFKLKSKK